MPQIALGSEKNLLEKKFSDEIIVGKDILELLSSSMYTDPLIIFVNIFRIQLMQLTKQ